ncbi:HGGxSTG domain-containing protein [Hwanghaeella sp. 1Z406]|uniref:HGGxSTG domain-containing protein n=1 Tax=Hwanghaeella sp. 1Z406 TaxID=3402811 RepID=UPI003B679F8E
MQILEQKLRDSGLYGVRQTPRKNRPRCGAITKSGKPCQAPPVWDQRRNAPHNGRCKLHGGAIALGIPA